MKIRKLDKRMDVFKLVSKSQGNVAVLQDIKHQYFSQLIFPRNVRTNVRCRIDELLLSNRDELETSLPISRRDCFIRVSSLFIFNLKKASSRHF